VIRDYTLLTASVIAALVVLTSLVPQVVTSGAGVEGVPYYPMHSAICAIKSLQMVLSYYGYNYSESLLLQLSGWDYGAFYLPNQHVGFGIGLYPVTAMFRASNLLGFDMSYLSKSDFNDALNYVINALRNSTPVIIQLREHTVVAAGYTKDSLIINDPSGGPYSWSSLEDFEVLNISKHLSRDFIKYYKLISSRVGFGGYVRINYGVLRELWRSWWGTYQLIIIKPRKPREFINLSLWAEVLRYDGELELGITGGGGGGTYLSGVRAWRALAEDLALYFPSVVREYPANLYWIKSCMLDIATARRLDASSFLSSLANTIKSRNLSLASWYLERASDEFSYASVLVAQAIKYRSNSSLVKELLTRASKHVLKAAKYEELAGKYLIMASKEISKYPLRKEVINAVSKEGLTEEVTYALITAVIAAAAASVVAVLIKGRTKER